MKYYAVKKGRQPGIYESWEDCQKQTYKYSGAVFKGFDSYADADTFLKETAQPAAVNYALPYAYIDGTAKQDADRRPVMYGWGGFVHNGEEIHIIQGTGCNTEYLPERNIAGEVIGLMQVIFYCQKAGIKEINVYYDYAGLENWTTGAWKAKKPLANYYRFTAGILEEDVKVNYIHVKGHTGITGNEIADCLAKEAVGAKLRKKDVLLLQEFRAGHINDTLLRAGNGAGTPQQEKP